MSTSTEGQCDKHTTSNIVDAFFYPGHDRTDGLDALEDEGKYISHHRLFLNTQ
ncbi:hypothetical protein BDZ89DRAFT_1086238 [Hymenopellis radicata]|nr:hypothetical protein BDZ89DRAFT_1086238 [Hymenopellis radicata]